MIQVHNNISDSVIQKMDNSALLSLNRRRNALIISVIILIIAGYSLAKALRYDRQIAWVYVAAFYGIWILLTLAFLLKRSDIKKLFQPGHANVWYLLPGLLAIPIFVLIFIPNRHILQLDYWLLLNIFVCLFNPWLEELYWRGLVYRLFKENPTTSFLLSAVGFGLGHALIFGINSPGIRGVPGFVGAFAIGAIWWFCLRKTQSLKGAIVTHFLVDLAGMAVYVLADKLVILRLPDL